MFQGRMLSVVASLAMVLGAAQVASAAPEHEAVPGEYVVKIKKGSRAFQMGTAAQVFGANDVQVLSEKNNVFLIKRNMLETSEYSMSSIQRVPGVEIVEPNYIYKAIAVPNDPMLFDLWGLVNDGSKGREGFDISATAAWDIQTGSHDVIVAVIDTGIDHSHADLQGNLWVNDAELNGTPGVDDDGNGIVDDIYGADFVNNDGDPMDDHGHGTHCAGTIGARGNDGQGIVGVAWNVRLMGVKFLSASGSGTLAAAVQSIDYARMMGARIMSNSWGGGGFSEVLEQAIKDARDAGILFVAAAGNDGSNNDFRPMYPASYEVENVISVAALDSQGQLAWFSNYGANSVDIAAPGVDVTSSVPGGYATWSGTSMATPHVSGVAALLASHDPSLTYLDVINLLIGTARPVSSVANKTVAGGMVNAYFALLGEQAPPDADDPSNWEAVAYAVSTPHPYSDNFAIDYLVEVPGANQISVFFDRFETENGYDTVQFLDAQGNVIATWSGDHSGEFSPVVQGSRMILRFTTDISITEYGFDISRVAYR